MKVKLHPACGNSPKMKLVQELTILFASYELEPLGTYFEDDIEWHLVGNRPIKGKENFVSELIKMRQYKVEELSVYTIVTHGKEAAVNGEMKMSNGIRYGFADFYRFSGASAKKIKSITSYVLQIGPAS